jgi:hypothetical protein
MPISWGMSPAWRDPKRSHRDQRPERPGAKHRGRERHSPRSAVNLPLPVFLKLLRQNPPKSP